MKQTLSTSSLSLAFFLSIASAGIANANDDFEGGANPSGWTFAQTNPDMVENAGGNPNGWLHNDTVFSVPTAESDGSIPSAFNGDFRAMMVSGATVDAQTVSVGITAANHNFTILLRDTKGTIGTSDDDWAYSVSSQVPQPGQGWQSYSFFIPSQVTVSVPAGWVGGHTGNSSSFRPGIDWNDVIQSVDVVEFWWGNPSFLSIGQNWDVGIDNACMITPGSNIPTFCDPADPNSTGLPTVLSGTLGGAIGSGLHLGCTQGPPNEFGYFLVGTGSSEPGTPISQGHLCLAQTGGNQIGRYNITGTTWNSLGQFDTAGILQNLVGTGTSAGGTGFDVPSSVPSIGGTIISGSTWHFQLWHREAMSNSNFSNGLSVTFP